MSGATLFTAEAPKTRKRAALTEEELVGRLRVRYTEQAGNGAAWAFIPKVRSAAAFDARRTIDAYAMSLWPSRGLSLMAFEIKSSRSDWQRELKNPAKAEEFCELADYFYLVVGDKGIVRPGELPETWGLLVPHGTGLKIEVEAPRLRPAGDGRIKALPPGFSRSYLAALLRAATYVASRTPEDIADAERRGRESEAAVVRRSREDWQQQFNELNARVREFEQAAGIQIGASQWHHQKPAVVGAAVKTVLAGDGEIERLNSRLERLRADAQAIVDHATQLLSSDGESKAA